MKKRKRIHKQLEKIYLRKRKQFSRTDRLLFNLLIAKLSKTKKMTVVVFVVKILKWLIRFIFTDSRPGSFLFCYGFKAQYKRLCIQKYAIFA